MNKKALAQKINSLDALSKEEKAELTELLNTKRYGLVWEDKPEALEEELKTQLPVLMEVVSKKIAPLTPKGGVISAKLPQQPSQLGLSFGLSVTEGRTEKTEENSDSKTPPSGRFDASMRGANHSLIEGDNLHALTVLNYTHANKIDVIYIDPPYNTGNKDFKYNDHFVDKEDGYRHSKWLSFMAKRLRLAKNLLSDKGVIFISIDDNENAPLRLLCDEIFGENNFVADIIWQARKSVSNDTFVSLSHNYTYFYGKNVSNLNKNDFRLPIKVEKFENPDNDERGPWAADPFDAPNLRPNLTYPIENPNTKEVFMPPKGRCWRTTPEEYYRFLSENRIVFGKNGKSKPQFKRFLSEAESKGSVTTTIWNDIETTTNGTQLLEQILGEKNFNNPKPIGLLNRILKLCTKPNQNSTVLDFFAGSGTTLHAVMALNAEDGGSRQCILVTNNENNICEEVTYERNKRVIEGYYKNSPQQPPPPPMGELPSPILAPPSGAAVFVPGLSGNNLRYYKTGYVPKASNENNKRLLTQSCTDLLCIKENCYEDITAVSGFEAIKTRVFKTDANGDTPEKYMIVVYHSRQPVAVFKQLKTFINALETSQKIRVYAFSSGKDSLEAELIDVADKIEAVPLPDAIANAYNACFRVLRTKHSHVEIKTETTLNEDEA